MKEYNVFFEIFDKKMKATVFASSKEEAKQKIVNKINKIIWHKIVEIPQPVFNNSKIIDYKLWEE